MLEPATLNFLYAAGCQVAGVLACVYLVALLLTRTFNGPQR
jgi:hypothetical protein